MPDLFEMPEDELTLREILDGMLGAYKPGAFDVFIDGPGTGAIYSIERSGDHPSVTNTAALFRIANSNKTMINRNTTGFSAFLKEELGKEKGKLTQALEEPETATYAAYRTVEILRAIPDEGPSEEVGNWAVQYMKGWLLGTSNFEPSIFLIFLICEAQPSLRVEQNRLIGRFLESVLSRIIAKARAGTHRFDAVDLAIGLSMIDSSHMAPEVSTIGIDLLIDAVKMQRIWTNRQPVFRSREKSFGCSAFEACVALCNKPALYAALRPALLPHLSWIQDRKLAFSEPWITSDLYEAEYVREPWFNCLVFTFLLRLREQAECALQRDLKHSYNSYDIEGKRGSDWFAVEDLPLPENTKSAIAGIKSEGNGLNANTVILFGPPGTAKTTTAKAIAKQLEWPFIELGVANFLRDGMDRVFERAAHIFDDLTHMKEVVVLLDEVENVFANREDDASTPMQKFLTAALLPPLQRVAERRSIALIIATNHIAVFDAAIRRPGRIDYIIPVGPPSCAQRHKLLKKICGLDEEVAGHLAAKLRDGTTLAELKLIGKLNVLMVGDPEVVADHLNEAWGLRVGGRYEIDDTALATFNQEVKDFERLY